MAATTIVSHSPEEEARPARRTSEASELYWRPGVFPETVVLAGKTWTKASIQKDLAGDIAFVDYVTDTVDDGTWRVFND